MDPIVALLALSIIPAPQVSLTPAAPARPEAIVVRAENLLPERIYAVRAVAIGPTATDCIERRARAVRSDWRGDLRAVLDPAPAPQRRGASVHDFADSWCSRQAYRVTVRLGGERYPAARAVFRAAEGRSV